MRGKLGPDFWGQWYRVDKPGTGSHTEEQLAKEVQSLSLQTTLTHEDTTISMEQLRTNLLRVKEHLRMKGFCPCASDARVVGVWDLKPRACNSMCFAIVVAPGRACPSRGEFRCTLADLGTLLTAEWWQARLS